MLLERCLFTNLISLYSYFVIFVALCDLPYRQVVTNISLALGELFNFRMSTFAEMHDLATGGRSTQWRERADSAQQSVDELTIVYHAACLELLGGNKNRNII